MLKPYKSRSLELTTEGGCILWGARVVVPTSLRENVLKQLHEVHPGASRMKALARSYVWWPNIDSAIDDVVRRCVTCQANQSNPAGAPSHPWEYPCSPRERLHIDHAGPVDGKMFLIVVDAYSKWIDVEIARSTDAKSTVAILRKLFSIHGIPRVIVSDNGPGFASEKFKAFLDNNGIKHMYSAPYHPASNGQAERTVRTFKESMKKLSAGDIETKLCRFLLRYRITPHTLTGVSPAEMLFKRRLRTALTMLRPAAGASIRERQLESVISRNSRSFRVGEEVCAKNFGTGVKWLPGVVTEILGATNYKILLLDGRTMHRHIDQLVKRHPAVENRNEAANKAGPELLAEPIIPSEVAAPLAIQREQGLVTFPREDEIVQPMPSRVEQHGSMEATSSSPATSTVIEPEATSPTEPELRHSAQMWKKPAYLEEYV